MAGRGTKNTNGDVSFVPNQKKMNLIRFNDRGLVTGEKRKTANFGSHALFKAVVTDSPHFAVVEAASFSSLFHHRFVSLITLP